MLLTSIILHANLQYAEIHPKDIPSVIEKSYKPVLTGLLSLPRGKVILNFTGVTLELLQKDYPEILKILRTGIKWGVFEVMGSAHGHPILPLVPDYEITLHVKRHLSILKKTLGVEEPKGFWPPELAWDNKMLSVLADHNFLWTPLDYHLIQRSVGKKTTNLNKLMIDWNDIKGKRSFRFKFENLFSILTRFKNDLSDLDFQPRVISNELRGGKLFYAIPVKQAWSPYYTFLTVLLPWLSLQRRFLRITDRVMTDSIFIPFASDLEVIGYGGYMKFHLAVNKFIDFIKKLATSKEILLGSPTDFLKNNKMKYPTVDLKDGSWSPEGDFSLWTRGESNKKLMVICKKVRGLIPTISDKKIIDKIYEALLLAEGADGKGWAPIQIRKDFCLKMARKALSLAKKSVI